MFSQEEAQQFSDETDFRKGDILKMQETLKENGYQFKKRIQDQNPKRKFSRQFILGEGGQAMIVLGEQIDTKQEVAIKFSRSSKKIYKDVCLELQAVDKIFNYEYVVQVYKHFLLEEELICILVMELCDKSLEDEIKQLVAEKKQYSYDQIVEILFSAINALCEIHTNDIIHFDIKPSNILIKDGKYKLSDFGHAKFQSINKSYVSSYGMGTIRYQSPEQYEAILNSQSSQSGEDGFKLKNLTDIYSMGISLLVALGIQLNMNNITALNDNNINYIDSQMKSEYKNIYSFIKYYMLQYDFNKRYSAIQLRTEFISHFENQFSYNTEKMRILKSIQEYEASQKKNNKYLAYLYFFLSQITNNENDIQRSLEIITSLDLNGRFEESLFLQQQSSILRIHQKYIDSFKILEKSHQIKTAILNFNHLEIGFSYQQYSNYYHSTLDFNNYLNFSKRAHSIFLFNFDNIHPLIAESLNTIGFCYGYLGDANKELEYYLKALDMYQSLYSGNHHDIALSLNNIGSCYGSLGDANKQLEYFLKALDMRQSLYSGNHPNIADSLNNIGSSYGSLGDANKQLEYYLKALDMYQSLYSGNHPDIALSLNNIGSSYGSLGDANKELEYLLKALDIYQSLYQGNHPSIAHSLNNIGQSYGSLGDANKELEYYLKALDMYQPLYSGNHPYIALSLNNIGSSYGSLGDANKELEYYLKALDMYQSLYSGNHPDIARSLNNIGSSYGSLGDANKSLEYFLKALDMYQSLYSGNHPYIALSLNNIGSSYGSLGDANKELEYYLKALDMYQSLYSGNHPDIADSLNSIAQCYHSLGDIQKHQEYLNKVEQQKKLIN